MGNGDFFDEVAYLWDEMRKSFFSETIRDKALAIADVEEGRMAADIGAGTGFITEGLVRKGLQVVAVDKSKAMLKEMKKKFKSSVNYCVGDAERLPISDKSVDYVFANMCLHHVESPLKAIREMVRILKPRGKLVITDMDEHNFKILRDVHHDRWMGFKREDIKQWFKEAGLKNVRVECTGENCCSSNCRNITIFVALGQK